MANVIDCGAPPGDSWKVAFGAVPTTEDRVHTRRILIADPELKNEPTSILPGRITYMTSEWSMAEVKSLANAYKELWIACWAAKWLRETCGG